MPNPVEVDDVIALAIEEAGRMRAAVADAPMGAKVNIEAAQFRTLAHLLETLAQRAMPEEGTFDDPRYWVPLDHFQRLKSTNAQLVEECSRLQNGGRFEDLLRF